MIRKEKREEKRVRTVFIVDSRIYISVQILGLILGFPALLLDGVPILLRIIGIIFLTLGFALSFWCESEKLHGSVTSPTEGS